MASPRRKHTSQRDADAADPFADDTVAVPAATVVGGKAAAPDASGSDDLVTWEEGEVVQRERSIYDTWTDRKRYTLLGLMSFATFLVPFSGERSASGWFFGQALLRAVLSGGRGPQHALCRAGWLASRLGSLKHVREVAQGGRWYGGRQLLPVAWVCLLLQPRRRQQLILYPTACPCGSTVGPAAAVGTQQQGGLPVSRSNKTLPPRPACQLHSICRPAPRHITRDVRAQFRQHTHTQLHTYTHNCTPTQLHNLISPADAQTPSTCRP
jgi:hypothetical protein